MEKIKEILEDKHNKENRDAIIKYVGNDKKKMKVLMSFFLDDKWHWRYNQRASWPIGVIGKKKPHLIQPYLGRMVKALENPSHDAIARNTINIFQEIDVQEALEGELYARCFEFLCDPKVAIAIRAFSITVLLKIAMKYEDLKPELIAALEEHYPHGSSGFKNRAGKALNKLKS